METGQGEVTLDGFTPDFPSSETAGRRPGAEL